jgi:Zn-dependent protease
MQPELIALVILILLFSVIVHEVMHGLAALRFGDRTAENAGRLTLNPLPHIDPIGTILVPGFLILMNTPFLIGWAKPVPVNPLNFSDIRKGELVVSLAGVASNFAMAIVAAILFHIANNFGANILLLQALSFAVFINLLLGIFNLLPIPPLDGSKVLISQLPYNLSREIQKIEPFGFLILVMLLATGVLGLILRTFLTPIQSILAVPFIW